MDSKELEVAVRYFSDLIEEESQGFTDWIDLEPSFELTYFEGKWQLTFGLCSGCVEGKIEKINDSPKWMIINVLWRLQQDLERWIEARPKHGLDVSAEKRVLPEIKKRIRQVRKWDEEMVSA